MNFALQMKLNLKGNKMKVKELLEVLNKVDPEAYVVTQSEDSEEYQWENHYAGIGIWIEDASKFFDLEDIKDGNLEDLEAEFGDYEGFKDGYRDDYIGLTKKELEFLKKQIPNAVYIA